MNAITWGVGAAGAAVLLILIALLLVVTRLFRKVEQGKALIVSKVRSVDVTFTGQVVLPVLHKAETLDISVKTLEISRTGREGLICRDNIRADIRIQFFLRVNKTVEDVIRVAQSIGTARASDAGALQEFFNAKFSEALKTVGKQLDFTDLYTQREEFRDRIIAVIGTDLNGYSLEDAAIDYVEQTPLAQLDAQNILDAQGIRKITELTAAEHVRTNEFQRHEEKEITRQDVDAREAILELERRRSDAEIRQRREIETLRAREEAEIARVAEEERLRAQTAFLHTEENLGVQRENQAREIAVAQKNRERVIAVESERIEKDRLLEVIARDRETELTRIAADKEVEAERRDIAEVIRERVAVDRTVAEQEESIKRLRAVEEAERDRQALVIAAEAVAQEQLVKDIKAAEAAEQAAVHRANEELTLAEARVKAAGLDAQAKLKLAEGIQAERAAEGLARVQVQEKEADALEKTGLAEAQATEARLRAEAEGERAKALARAEGTTAQASADAAAVGEKLKAEAAGLTEKAAAMAALDEASRGHEEYRLRLAAEKEIRLAGLQAQKEVAEAQATVLATGLESADINIVGGESVFFDRIVDSVSFGKGLDAFVSNSATAQRLGADWLDGTSSFTGDLTSVLSSVTSGGLRDLSASALMGRLAKEGIPADRAGELLDRAREAGLLTADATPAPAGAARNGATDTAG
ncbi:MULTISPECIES: flotillin family protein [Streptomyces]|uniref:Flotillin family protein n=1 Tax=Streptomyces odorifer TaxID=53450 RepID=A0A7Y6EXW1_9ACTN|nr:MULTISPECIES: flotillin family protein [Streptomyces]NUV35532.1 flotillin family protein [Streptomyces sp. KAI-27]NUV48915.1 flotillin family protein [Streptomyces sp. CAI-78]MBV1958554.1 flotillin family protein [Streptomyces sp. BV333]MCK2140218.1 flotillin family protein [Streptomyces sp. WAC00276]MCR0990660.1 flotillin family protein [Streptomyces albidoflavus]